MPAKRLDLTDSLGLELPWLAEDSSTLREFLKTTTGKRFLGQLILKRPRASERTDPFKRGIQSGVQEGFDECIDRIGILTNPDKSVTKNV